MGPTPAPRSSSGRTLCLHPGGRSLIHSLPSTPSPNRGCFFWLQMQALGSLSTPMGWPWVSPPPWTTGSHAHLLPASAPPAPSPPPPANSSSVMAPGSVPYRWHLLPHLPESRPRARRLHRPHLCFRQRRGRGHAHRGLCRDCAGPAPGEAGAGAWAEGAQVACCLLPHPICARPSCPSLCPAFPSGTKATV